MLRRALVTVVTRQWLLFALGLALSILVAACGSTTCSHVGCVDAFVVNVSSTGAPKEGKYTLVVVADGVTSTCAIEYNASSCSRRVLMRVGGNGLIRIEVGLSASVKIAVYRDGVELGSKSFTPTYSEYYPNGPECGGACTTATDTFVFAH